MSNPVLIISDAHVAEIRFNRPLVRNALNLETAHAFAAAVDQVLADPAVRAVVIAAEGRAFMAGGDLGYFRNEDQIARPEASRRLIAPLNTAIMKLAQGPKPTIACVNGSAAGAGMSLALMADLAIASEDATFNLSYVKVAASPDCGGSFALVRLVGIRKAMEIALLSDTLDAEAALRLGLVNKIVPAAQLREQAFDWARRLAKASPLSLGATKRLLRGALTTPLSDQLEAEMESFAALSGTRDFEEALEAFFGKRQPNFLGR